MASLRTINAGDPENHRRELLRCLQKHVLSLYQNLRSLPRRFSGAGLRHYRAVGLPINTRAARINELPDRGVRQPIDQVAHALQVNSAIIIRSSMRGRDAVYYPI